MCRKNKKCIECQNRVEDPKYPVQKGFLPIPYCMKKAKIIVNPTIMIRCRKSVV